MYLIGKYVKKTENINGPINMYKIQYEKKEYEWRFLFIFLPAKEYKCWRWYGKVFPYFKFLCAVLKKNNWNHHKKIITKSHYSYRNFITNYKGWLKTCIWIFINNIRFRMMLKMRMIPPVNILTLNKISSHFISFHLKSFIQISQTPIKEWANLFNKWFHLLSLNTDECPKSCWKKPHWT